MNSGGRDNAATPRSAVDVGREMTSPAALTFQEATPWQRRFAAVIQATSIFFPILAPVIGLAIFRKVPFVAAHALQAIYGFFGVKLTLFLVMATSFILGVVHLIGAIQTGFEDFSIWPTVFRMGIVLVILGLLAMINFVVSVRDCIRALNGSWPKHGKVLKRLQEILAK